MKKHLRVFTWILALPLILASQTGWTQELEKVLVGHSNIRNDIAALWVPKDLGIFRKNGLDVNVVLITGGVRMTQAILSGSAPMGFTGATLVPGTDDYEFLARGEGNHGPPRVLDLLAADKFSPP